MRSLTTLRAIGGTGILPVILRVIARNDACNDGRDARPTCCRK